MITEELVLKVFVADKNKDGSPVMSFGRPAKKVAIKVDNDKYAGKWIYSYPTSRADDPVLQIKEGVNIKVIIWMKDQWLNFRLPKKIDELEDRVSALEKFMIQEPISEMPTPEDDIDPTDLPF